MLHPNIHKSKNETKKKYKKWEHLPFTTTTPKNALFCRVPGSVPKHTHKKTTQSCRRVEQIWRIKSNQTRWPVRTRDLPVDRWAYVPHIQTNKKLIWFQPTTMSSQIETTTSSDFDDDIDFDPDDLTILLHFFRVLWDQLPISPPKGPCRRPLQSATVYPSLSSSSTSSYQRILLPIFLLLLLLQQQLKKLQQSTTTTEQLITSNPSFVYHTFYYAVFH